ncbi:hypothetical protein M569_02379, partial [Genlisea aurea]
ASEDMSLKKKELRSTAMKRTSEWIFSQEIPSDITIKVGDNSFSLHKFPLVSKCGYIRRFVSESDEADDPTTLEIDDIPGGAESFDYAAKFCYGINFEMNAGNIAAIRCAAEFLEMTEDYAVGNLVSRAESYISEVALTSLSVAVSVLHTCENNNLLPVAEDVKLVSRCIDAIALFACRGSRLNHLPSPNARPKVDLWTEDLTLLRIDLFQRVLIAMSSRGFDPPSLGQILMLYAQKSFRGLDMVAKGRKKMDPREEHEKRVILETIVSLLPRERNTFSVSFLSMLLRAAIYLETTVSSRLDLEKRMASQLGQAVVDDLLIPSCSFAGDTLFDVEAVQRIMITFSECEVEMDRRGGEEGYCYVVSPSREDVERVTKLMENYLAEIASDRNLSVSKFISLSELIPDRSRATEDGMYRAIDIYLKAHPGLSDTERKTVCSVMDCQKLSREACAHAAQNDRLPVQTVVQVLYYEQQRLREAVDGGESSPAAAAAAAKGSPDSEEVAFLRRENRELKMEVLRLKMKLKEWETPAAAASVVRKPPLPKKSFMSSVSQKLGKLMRPPEGLSGSRPPKGRSWPSKDRRHSI